MGTPRRLRRIAFALRVFLRTGHAVDIANQEAPVALAADVLAAHGGVHVLRSWTPMSGARVQQPLPTRKPRRVTWPLPTTTSSERPVRGRLPTGVVPRVRRIQLVSGHDLVMSGGQGDVAY